MIQVKLTTTEIIQGSTAGMLRHVKIVQEGRKSVHGESLEDGWQRGIEGALGEMALAKHMGMYWSCGTFKGHDVGSLEVRTTPGMNNRLILHASDHDNARYYLVTGCNGEYYIRGWILGKDGKRPEFLTDPTGHRPPAYFVPQKELNAL